MPKVTIVMPAYNVESYITNSIESVINQTFKNWELIIINDGSTDQTRAYIEQYVQLDSRITCIDQDNSGVSAARNKGLLNASGDYISFLDSDDQYTPQYIELMLKALLTTHNEVVFCKFKELNGDIILRKTPEDIKSLYKNNFIKHIESISDSKINMAFMYKTQHIKNLGILFNTNISNAEDTEFLLKITYNSSITFIPDYLYLYIHRDNSLSRDIATNNRSVNKIRTYSHCMLFFRNNKNSNQKDYLLYIQNQLAVLYKDYIKLLWKQLRSGKHEDVIEGVSYFHEQVPQDLKLDKKYKYQYNPIKNLMLFIQIKILNSKNIKIWKIISKKHNK